MRVLMAAHPTVGHTNALRAIGRRLRERGHAVAFATSIVKLPPPWFPAPEVLRTGAEIPRALERDGFELVPLQVSLASLRHAVLTPFSRGYAEMRHALGMFAADLVAHAGALATAIDRVGADLVVGDYLMFAAYLAARLRGRPFAAFYHSALPFPGPDRPPFGSGLPFDAPRSEWTAAQREFDAIAELGMRILSRASRELGLPATSRAILGAPYSEHCNLLATTRALEPGLPELPGPVHFVGPCLEGRVEDGGHPVFEALKKGPTRVYVSMGTVFNTNRDVFISILRGLDRPGVQVIVSAGASFAALSRRPPTSNASYFARVPQLAVLREVDLVVGHGGNNSTLETIAAGRPLVVVPFGGDQLENARRVEALGTGVAVLPDQLSAGAVSRAFDLALTRRDRARALGESLAGVDGTSASVAILESLVG